MRKKEKKKDGNKANRKIPALNLETLKYQVLPSPSV